MKKAPKNEGLVSQRGLPELRVIARTAAVLKSRQVPLTAESLHEASEEAIAGETIERQGSGMK